MMYCPKCGEKAKVLDNVFDEENEQMLRKNHCPKCNNIFYTLEEEVQFTGNVKYNWGLYHRRNAYIPKRNR